MQLETMEAARRVARPFKSLEELYSELNNLEYWPGIVNLRQSVDYVYRGIDADAETDKIETIKRDALPKTIVCHDFKGGYLEDRFIDGSNEYKSYHFYHWSLIDTFIYFSHFFVTIPPFGWINAAHKHGVKVLGTIITENEKGQEVWNEILKTRENITKFADALIEIARFYNFEGWLLNVENEISETEITKLIFFIQYLTKNIHKKVQNSEIIWYDSVTNAGKLCWQNELNEKNECFFDSCDGIFLNYNWTDSRLINSVINADKRKRVKDVYVGLDVWGRGCPGGGGFNSAHALQRIRKQDLSVAIFAPAWTFEYFGPETFPKIENIFWAQLIEYLYIHVPIYEKERFITTFCRGSGAKYFEFGAQIKYEDPITHNVIEKNSSFYNMSMQKHQVIAGCLHLKFISMDIVPPLKPDENSKPIPQVCTYETSHEILKVLENQITIIDKPNSYAGKNCMEYSYSLSYEGGGCLKLINGNISSYHRLLFVYLEFTRDILVRIIYKNINTDSTESNHPVLILGNSMGITSYLPRNTMQYGFGWKMSVYRTSTRAVREVGVALTHSGSCHVGKLVLEEIRGPFHG